MSDIKLSAITCGSEVLVAKLYIIDSSRKILPNRTIKSSLTYSTFLNAVSNACRSVIESYFCVRTLLIGRPFPRTLFATAPVRVTILATVLTYEGRCFIISVVS